jgi:intraflagellar transport protein 172
MQVPQYHNDAFVFLNAFLDISEAIEDGTRATLDLSDLSDTGVFLDFALPERQAVYADEAAVEGVKEWVLDAAMQQNIAQEVSKRACANCGTDMFSGACLLSLAP